MGCCRCIKRLEHVEKVIETYDPNENFVNYDLLTVWVNKKTKKAFILVSKENGIATWVPINADITTIDKIILNCGEVEANENNEIEHVGECGARTVTDGCKDLCITINTDWGLKGGGNVCAGESLTVGIDLANTNLVISNAKDVQPGDLVTFDGTSGKIITKSNINSVNGLTKITKSTSGEQRLLVENTFGNDAVIQAKTTGNGYSYVQFSNDDNEWLASLNSSNKQLEIFPKVKGEQKSSILTMLPNGVMLMPWQPKAGGYLRTTPEFPTVTDFEIGSNLPFVKVLDEEGYNTAANNFFIGGSGQGASYTTTYEGGLYLVLFQFNVDKGNTGNPEQTALFTTKVKYGDRIYSFRTPLPVGRSFSTVSGTVILRGIKGQKISWSTAASNGTPKIAAFGPENEIDNYVGIYMLG